MLVLNITNYICEFSDMEEVSVDVPWFNNQKWKDFVNIMIVFLQTACKNLDTIPGKNNEYFVSPF